MATTLRIADNNRIAAARNSAPRHADSVDVGNAATKGQLHRAHATIEGIVPEQRIVSQNTLYEPGWDV